MIGITYYLETQKNRYLKDPEVRKLGKVYFFRKEFLSMAELVSALPKPWTRFIFIFNPNLPHGKSD